MLIEAKSDVEVLTERNSAVKHELEAKNREVEDLGKACEHAVTQARKLLVICQNIMTSADEATKEFLRNRSQEETLEELEVEIESENARLELMHEGNGSVIREFEQRQKRIDGLRARLEEVQNVLTEFDTRIKDAREQWEPKLDRLIKRISESFAYNMKQINCAGEVGVYKDEEDFDQWAIQIRVKFRYDGCNLSTISPCNLLWMSSLLTYTSFLSQRIRTPHPPRLASPIRRRACRLHNLLPHVPAIPHPLTLSRRRRNQPRHGSA